MELVPEGIVYEGSRYSKPYHTKSMKRILSLLIALALVLGCMSMLGGCKQPSGSGNKPSGDPYAGLSDEEYMQKLAKENLDAIIDTFTSAYGAYLSASGTPADISGKVNLSAKIGDTIIDQLENSLYQATGENYSFDFLSNIGLDMEFASKDDLYQYSVGIALAQQKIMTVQILLDYAKYILWMGCPDLNDRFLEMDLSEEIGTDAQSATAATTALLNALPSEEILKTLLDRYLGMILAELKNVKRTETTLELDGLSQKCTEMTLKVYEKDAYTIVKAVLTAAKDDKELKTVVENFGKFYNDMNSTGTPIDLYPQFQSAVQDALDDLADITEFDTETYIELITYIDAEHKVLGRKLTMPDETAPLFYYYTVTDGNAFTFIAESEEAEFSITGEGTVKNGTVDGEYILTAEDTQLLTLSVKDWKADKETVKGTLHIKPSASLMDSLIGDMSALSFADLALEMKLDLADTAKIELNLVSNEKLIVGLDLSVQNASVTTMSKPTNAVNAMDSVAMQAWAQNLKLDTIVNNLKKAGVSDELMNLLMQMIAG